MTKSTRQSCTTSTLITHLWTTQQHINDFKSMPWLQTNWLNKTWQFSTNALSFLLLRNKYWSLKTNNIIWIWNCQIITEKPTKKVMNNQKRNSTYCWKLIKKSNRILKRNVRKILSSTNKFNFTVFNKCVLTWSKKVT